MGYPFIHIWLRGFNPSEKYELVSWDHDIPNIWENKIHVPNQPDIYIYVYIWLYPWYKKKKNSIS